MGKRKRGQGKAFKRPGASKLLSLPAEIRNRIYEFVLCFERSNTEPLGSVIKISQPSNEGQSNEAARRLPLLRVCRQIYLEAYHIFYSRNCFSFPNTDILFTFLRNIGYARRQEITSVKLCWLLPDKAPKAAFRLLQSCHKLKSVRIMLLRSQLPGYAALREIRGLECVVVRHMTPFDRLLRDNCRNTKEGCPCSEAESLRIDMSRPRLKQYRTKPDTIDLFNRDRPKCWKNEGDKLKEEYLKASVERRAL